MIKKYAKIWSDLLAYNGKDIEPKKFVFYLLICSFAVGGGAAVFVAHLEGIYIPMVMLAVFLISQAIVYMYYLLGAAARASKAEEVLPDFLSLMASNIKAGLTPDKAFIISARPEFGPLAKAVDDASKHSITGMPLEEVMMQMNIRINSEVLRQTVRLIVEGLHSGGDLSDLLEKTAFDLRKFRSVKKEINATIMNYVLFIMAAVAFGAPLLYAIASFLVEIMLKIKSKIGDTGALSAMGGINIFKGKLAFTPESITLFATLSIFVTVLFGTMAVGVMSSGKRIDGLKYFPLVMLIAITVFFGLKIVMASVLGPLMER